jgi:hypothetical protein
MGHTFYWETLERGLTKEEVKRCVAAIRQLIVNNANLIKIEFTDEPNNNNYNINFNSCNPQHRYETFCFYSKFKDNPNEEVYDMLQNQEEQKSVINYKGQLIFEHCKTNRMPYAQLVIRALQIIQQITDNKLNAYCDDGNSYYKDKIIKVKK